MLLQAREPARTRRRRRARSGSPRVHLDELDLGGDPVEPPVELAAVEGPGRETRGHIEGPRVAGAGGPSGPPLAEAQEDDGREDDRRCGGQRMAQDPSLPREQGGWSPGRIEPFHEGRVQCARLEALRAPADELEVRPLPAALLAGIEVREEAVRVRVLLLVHERDEARLQPPAVRTPGVHARPPSRRTVTPAGSQPARLMSFRIRLSALCMRLRTVFRGAWSRAAISLKESMACVRSRKTSRSAGERARSASTITRLSSRLWRSRSGSIPSLSASRASNPSLPRLVNAWAPLFLRRATSAATFRATAKSQASMRGCSTRTRAFWRSLRNVSWRLSSASSRSPRRLNRKSKRARWYRAKRISAPARSPARYRSRRTASGSLGSKDNTQGLPGKNRRLPYP